MPGTERRRDRGSRRGQAALTSLADEFRAKRNAIGIRQQQVATAAGVSRQTYSRIENSRLHQLPIVMASRLAAALGTDLSVRVFPGPERLRDSAQLDRLRRVLAHVTDPLRYGIEVPLPTTSERPCEQRALDAVVYRKLTRLLRAGQHPPSALVLV